MSLSCSEIKPPKRVFIVPYRNRVQQKFFFSKYMSFLLENDDDYEIYFSHQCDTRTFNRGAVKDIGFIAVKEKYPDHYKDITFIFNDVDTVPFNKIFTYDTVPGVIAHYYGFKYALGGIVVIKGCDFERINGFPCFWGWGMEDNCLQKRCNAYGLKTDRSTFYTIGSPQILQLFDGISRIISKKDPWRMEQDNGVDGIKTISHLDYSIDNSSLNPNDNLFTVQNPRIFFVNIKMFLTHIPYESDQYYSYDLREPKRKIIHPSKIKESPRLIVSTEDWSNIPYYPTASERRQEEASKLISEGKQVPLSLLAQIQEDKKNELKEDSYNKNVHFNKPFEVSGSHLNEAGQIEHESCNYDDNHNHNHNHNHDHNHTEKIHHPHHNPTIINKNIHPYPYYEHHHSAKIHNRPPPHSYTHKNIHHPSHIQSSTNIFTPGYATKIGQKPRATASARIRLGGAY